MCARTTDRIILYYPDEETVWIRFRVSGLAISTRPSFNTPIAVVAVGKRQLKMFRSRSRSMPTIVRASCLLQPISPTLLRNGEILDTPICPPPAAAASHQKETAAHPVFRFPLFADPFEMRAHHTHHIATLILVVDDEMRNSTPSIIITARRCLFSFSYYKQEEEKFLAPAFIVHQPSNHPSDRSNRAVCFCILKLPDNRSNSNREETNQRDLFAMFPAKDIIQAEPGK